MFFASRVAFGLYCEVAAQACIIVGVPVISIWMAVAPIMFWSEGMYTLGSGVH
jgi:hypothetical protein